LDTGAIERRLRHLARGIGLANAMHEGHGIHASETTHMSEHKSLTPQTNGNGHFVRPANAAGAMTPAVSDEEEGPDWSRVLSAIRRHATLVILIVALGITGSVFAAKMVDPLYRSTTTIWIASQTETQGRSGASLGPIRQEQLLQWESWVDLLRSFAILDPVVHDLRLNVMPSSPADSALFRTFASAASIRGGSYVLRVFGDGKFTLRSAPGRLGFLKGDTPVHDHGTLGDSIGERIGFLWAPARDSAFFGRTVRFAVTSPRTAAEALGQGLDARVDRNGAFLRVDLSGQSPTRTATILRAVATRYVQVASDLKRGRLADFTKNLDQQRAESRENLARAEKELELFRIKTVGLPRPDDAAGRGSSAASTDPLIKDGADLDRTRRDRRAIAAWLATQPAERPANGPLLSVENASADLKAALDELSQKRADLRALKYRYEDSYAAVQHLAEDITALSEQTIPAMVRQLDADLAAKERDLAYWVSNRTQQLRGVPSRLLEEARLTRAATEAADLNATVQTRYQEARLAQASSLPDVGVLDAAMPSPMPVSDLSMRILALGIVASAGIAFMVVILLDRFDPRVRYPAEVSRQMGLTILGAVPYLTARRENAAITPEAAEEVTEAMRGVRLALTHGGSVARPLLLTISSSGPGDGKSFITSNLGLSFALAGYRTLMIDGDVRRGALHRAFGVQRRPGLTDCLRGEISAHNAVQPTTFSSLGIIGCGTRTRLAPELLGGPKMQALINALSNEFDVILCDSPPLSAGVDPYLLASVTGQMLIVLRTGVSVRSVLAAKLAVLNQMPVTLVGAVLNAVPAGALYRPYSYHVAGYEAEDEPAAALPGI
jgi:succinoglycan biosynthesis transport protein ExoP